MLDKSQWLKPGKWVWVVMNEDNNRQERFIAMVLDKDNLGDVWVTYKNVNMFISGQVSVKDLIPLNSCTGWDYHP